MANKKDEKEKLEKDYGYCKLVYSSVARRNDDLTKSLIYLRWRMEQEILNYRHLLEECPTDAPTKYHLEQSIILLQGIQKEIELEIDKNYLDAMSKAFKYREIDDSSIIGFAGDNYSHYN